MKEWNKPRIEELDIQATCDYPAGDDPLLWIVLGGAGLLGIGDSGGGGS